MKRIYNFSAGPATLPLSVIEEASRGALEIQNSGMSILEVSHRGKISEKIHFEARDQILKSFNLDSKDYSVLFLGGGASLQFAMLPMNFLAPGQKAADYVHTGEWSGKAMKEAKLFGKVKMVSSSEEQKFACLPFTPKPSSDATYYHITTNNTIEGTQFHEIPDTGAVPLVADVSSDFASMTQDYKKYTMMYAGAQKNAGPAGVTIVVARKDFLAKAGEPGKDLPTILSYKTHEKGDSMYNTPPVYSIYIVGLIMKWIEAQGGLIAVEKTNRKKAGLIYDALDDHLQFYDPAVTDKKHRSLMNITFRLRDASLEEKFLAGAKELKLDGLKGHRSVGGFRASVYNAFPVEGCEVLADYIRKFAKQ